MIAIECCVKTFAKEFKGSDGFKTCHCHKNAKEEEDSAHVDAREHVGDAFLHTASLFGQCKVGIENLSDCPQNAENEQNADEGRQVGDGLEYWHKYESAYAKEEYGLALSLGEGIVHALVLTEVLHFEFAMQTA